jgi:preprotein translocase subunit SecG
MLTFVRIALGFILVLTSLFLILLVLIQRGRGGGLAGALGGAGGQSAFGTKAGDVFTRITVGVAAFWIGLCILALNVLGQRQSLFSGSLGGNAPQAIAPSTPPIGGPAAMPPAAPATPSDLQIPGQPPAAPAPEANAPATPSAPAPALESPPAADASAPTK